MGAVLEVADDPAVAYNEVAEVIEITVKRFVRKHGGNYDDLLADANTAFMLGYNACRNGRANATSFEVEIKRWVWYELFDAYRVRSQHRRQQKTVIKNEEMPEKFRDGTQFNMVDFKDALSEDARHVADLVLDPPAAIWSVAVAKGDAPRNWRSTVRAHLTEAGWCSHRINEAFTEIAEAL